MHWQPYLWSLVRQRHKEALGEETMRNSMGRAAVGRVAEMVGPQGRPERRSGAPTRVVILGGGFAGATTGEHLERAFGADPSVEVTLVSDTSTLLFTPMLAQVASGSLESSHISSPLRKLLRRTNVVRGRVTGIDLKRRMVLLAPEPSSLDGAAPPAVVRRMVPYDHLVVALGSVSNYFGMHNVEKEAFSFKTLWDAVRIRNHVIEVFERANREGDPEIRRALLTFVVAGGGSAGTAIAGGLNDFARGMLDHYPNVRPEEVQVVLVHPRERILPELSAPLATYAIERMADRGVTFRLNARVADAQPGVVVLDTAEEIRTETLVWTAGIIPNPLVSALPVERDKRGAVVVDDHLAVPGHRGVWAVGDCAAATDARTGASCPPTAQFALHEGYTLAHNVHASVRGRPLKAFHFDSPGTLSVVGYRRACAEIKGLRLCGLVGWLAWGAFYLPKLPGLERKVRVLVDWLMESFFSRDIVQTVKFDQPGSAHDDRGAAEPWASEAEAFALTGSSPQEEAVGA
jgi:NADH:ubiquinone reductase (H+-translocating)